MSTLQNAAAAPATQPAVRPIPKETVPANPNEPFGVGPKIIEEIEEIGRKYTGPKR
jgi:hypothetical protein